ncbi:sigma-70 family RNA polymerase sigma factor [Massilia glaciei]|uniref:RNA polymerase subunit sigma n=1 Tax=Massilia glaciei TaxID=1524097 RepID=A0A2U2HHN5_9BURK|nr:sigma-70 family RNA polymerase sigma factor [Massilia glaciei]PWF45414.1 RNA polymerase subunit sigma [Massilia glaciei]
MTTVARAIQAERLVILLKGIGEGDCGAFRELYAMTVARLLPSALRIVKNHTVADDVLQESFISIWKNAHTFNSAIASPITWMTTIVRNKALDQLRANQFRNQCISLQDCDGAMMDLRDTGATPCESLEGVQVRRLMDVGLGTLGSLQRTAIEMAYFQDLTHAEVADEMALPLGTIKTWIRRGCAQMRQQIRRAEGRNEQVSISIARKKSDPIKFLLCQTS